MGVRVPARRALLCLAGVSMISAAIAQSAPVPVEVKREAGHFRLFRGGEPYEVRGAGTQSVDDDQGGAAHAIVPFLVVGT